MARDADSEKSSRRRFGRGRAEEGPSDEDLGWLADLRGGGERTPLGPDEPTGPAARGRRPAPPPEEPTGRASRTRQGGEEAWRGGDEPRRDESRRDESRGRGRSREVPLPPGPVLPAPTPVPPAASLGQAPPDAPSRPSRRSATPPPASPPTPSGTGRGGRGATAPSAWSSDLTDEVPAVRDEPPPRPIEPRPTEPRLTEPRLTEPRLTEPRLTEPRRRTDPRGARPGPLGRPPEGPTGGIPAGPLPGGPPIPGAALGPGGVGPALPGAGGGPGGGPKPPLDPLVTTGKIRRAEMRRQLRAAQQLKVATLTIVAILLLAAYPVYLFIRSGTQDPVFDDLDALDLPGWAATQHEDASQGSRWCIGLCRFHVRTWASERAPDETDQAYRTALTDAGWRPRTEGTCPPAVEGLASCWKRDEYVMDMWVRAPICDIPPPRPSFTGKTAKATPTGAALVEPSPQSAFCPGSLVTMQVYNAISYPGGPADLGPTGPAPTQPITTPSPP